MKKRKILFLFPLLGLLLTGCDMKEVLINAKSWVKQNVYYPAKSLIDGQSGEQKQEEQKQEEQQQEEQKEDESQKPAAHTHSYDLENIEWAWSELQAGGYSAKVVLTCKTCSESDEGHELELDAQVTSSETKAPTCTTPGTMTYTATVTYEGQTLTDTKAKQITDANAHHYVEVKEEQFLKSAATCTEDAVYFKSCEYCHEKGEETFIDSGSKLGHHMVHHAATTSTCQEHGHQEYYECDRCNKLFADENGATEKTAEELELPLAHHYVEVQEEQYLKSSATCTEDAVYFKSCEFCHEKGEETFTVANTKLGHQMTHYDAASSNCHEHGNIEYYQCTRCNKFFADANGATELTAAQIELPLTDHDMTAHAEVPATCTSDGTKAYWTCSYEPDVKYKDAQGTEKFNSDSELVIEKLGHQFNESLNCVRGDTTLKDEYEMVDATAFDAVAPATISDLGLTSGGYIPSGTSHLWGNYDYVSNGGIDLWFKLAYPTPESGTDYYTLVYLFNDGGEGGIVFRFGLSRLEDDGIIPVYIFTQNDYSSNPGTTVVHTAGAAGTFFYMPRSSGVKSSTENILHLKASCLDEDTNLFRCAFTAGVEGGTQYYPSTNPEDSTNTPMTFDICLGASYFNNGAGRKVRMSCNAADRAAISDVASEEKALIYKDAAGNLAGKLVNPASAKIPTLVAENKTFLGWFDIKGNKVNDGDPVTTKQIITPRFIDTQDKMFVPSDTLGGEFSSANGGWYSSDSFEGECGGQLPVNEVTDRFDLYFNYHFVSRTASDNYAIFGLPFDFIDAQTRLHVRIDNKENGNLVGYIYGPNSSLGSAGAAGTQFSEVGFRANGSDLLIHIAVYNASGAGLTMLVEIVNLGNGQVFQTTRDVTFNTADLYSISSPTRNVFDLMKANCTYQISDAF